MGAKLILVKHAQPILDETRPPRRWRLGPEGEAQARLLAKRLAAFRPFALVSSREPKARKTAEIISAELGVPFRTQPGLEEIDRPRLTIMSKEGHRQLNKPIFEDLVKPHIGNESGREALSRFSAAVGRELARLEDGLNLAAVAHGTVISLFVSEHDKSVDGWELWQRLQCTSCVVLRLPALKLEQIVNPVVSSIE